MRCRASYIPTAFTWRLKRAGNAGDASDFNGGVASVDPHFFVEPTFINAGDYQILLSDGIGNAIASGVPEPTAWTLLLLGVGVIGADRAHGAS